MAKLLIIDKCCFQGSPWTPLLKFVKDYHVVLPHVLCVECLISENPEGARPAKDPLCLLGRLNDVFNAGASIGYSSLALFRMEKESCCSAQSVVDEKGTQQAKNGMIPLDRSFISREAQICKESFDPLHNLLLKFAKTYLKTLTSKDLAAKFRKDYQSSDVERFKEWLQAADTMKDSITQYWFPSLSKIMGNDWYT